jgi:hypothetical protein
MSEDKIVIAAEILDGHHAEGMAIICAPTGIICTVQAGGISCEQPKVEGYRLPIWMHDSKSFYEALKEFDDCKWGCYAGKAWNNLDDEERIKYAEAIDKFLKESVNWVENLENIRFSFDYERIEEVMEGWWPVLVQFHHYEYGYYDRKFKGYLHFGNCD